MSSTPESEKRFRLDQTTLALVRRLLRGYVRHHAPTIAAAVLSMIVVALSTAAFPKLVQPIIDEIFVARKAELLWPIALFALAIFAVRGAATYAQAVLMNIVGHSIVARLQRQLFRRLIGADLAYYSRTAPGSLIARFINDIAMLRAAVSDTMTGFGKDALTAAALVGVMFYEDWLLATVALLALPIAVLPMIRVGRHMRRVSDRTHSQVGRLTTLLDEVFQGFRHVKAYGMEAYETARADAAVEALRRLNIKSARTRNILHPIMELLAGLAVVAVILYGGHQVISGAKAPGSFFAFIFALLLAYEPVKRLTKLNVALQEGLAAAARIFALLDMTPGILEQPGAGNLQVTGGAVAFEGVHFSYDTERSALYGLDLEVPPGSTVALVGPSGSGKSTVLNLIPRFYDPNEGRVTIDGQDVRSVTFASLRRAIALVSQEILLFDDTVGANIAYGRPDADRAEIEAAARLADAHDFIAALAGGYDTLVGPRGVRLSGGQRQRIAIARAMLKNAPILLLDEATSALDTESERQVQQALETLMAGRTTLVIAHRLSTVIGADLIYVLEEGRVVERGRHAELLARGGTYARLHALQFAEAPEGPEPDPGDGAAEAVKLLVRA